MRELILRVQGGHNLSMSEIAAVMKEIMTGGTREEDIRDFLLALNAKGPTVDEIAGAATLMREVMTPVKTRHELVLDTCGTGGDHKHTFNISTIAAFVVAAARVAVAKHGNRSVSSHCGSADLLEALGVNLTLDDRQMTRCLDEVGIAFLFAQALHPAMKNVAPVRKALKVKTIFNILGPLTNPARATHQVMGVYSRDLVEPVAKVLGRMGLTRGLVVHGNDGLDEITTTDKTFVAEFNGRDVQTYDITPEELGIPRARLEDLVTRSLEENTAAFVSVLQGAHGPRRDIVALNAAYALYICGHCATVASGLADAYYLIDNGKALRKFEQLRKFTTHGSL